MAKAILRAFLYIGYGRVVTFHPAERYRMERMVKLPVTKVVKTVVSYIAG